MGLLLLRAVVGLTAVVQGVAYLSGGRHSTPGALLSVLLLAASASLLAGFLTPVASLVVGLGAAGVLLSWFPASFGPFVGCELASSERIAVCLAIACLGPGAFSLDSLLFGRREMVIPPVSPSARS